MKIRQSARIVLAVAVMAAVAFAGAMIPNGDYNVFNDVGTNTGKMHSRNSGLNMGYDEFPIGPGGDDAVLTWRSSTGRYNLYPPGNHEVEFTPVPGGSGWTWERFDQNNNVIETGSMR